MRNRGCNRRPNQRQTLGTADVERNTRPRRDSLMPILSQCADSERGGFIVDDVVGAVDTEVLDVGVVAGPVSPVDVGAEAEAGELVGFCGCFPVPFCGAGGIFEVFAYDG
jgi:hypothetical protein